MLNAIPIVGWLLSLIFSVSLAIPFWICYTVCGLGVKYFYWLPKVYQAVPFWHCVGLFICISVLKSMLVPKFSSVSNQNESK